MLQPIKSSLRTCRIERHVNCGFAKIDAANVRRSRRDKYSSDGEIDIEVTLVMKVLPDFIALSMS